MSDRFFTQAACDRCGGDLSGGRTMSMFSEECICMECACKERSHRDYDKARDAERRAVAGGDANFPGIGRPPDL